MFILFSQKAFLERVVVWGEKKRVANEYDLP